MYRALLASGMLKQRTPVSDFEHKPSYTLKFIGNDYVVGELSPFFAQKIEEIASGKFRLFFDEPVPLDSWEGWCFHKEERTDAHWTSSPINRVAGHDIKLTWDLSRFQWMLESSLAIRYSRCEYLLPIIEERIKSWCEYNPKNTGVNWVCAQECSIRMLNFIISTELLSPVCKQNKLFVNEFIISNLRRIDASLIYSISQDNNHGITESAALYIGALYLEASHGESGVNKDIEKWKKKGKKFLIDRLNQLVFDDGGFAMYSSNYHRSVLNLLIVVSVLENLYTKDKIAELLSTKAKNMITWLESLVNVHTGDFPNLGTNDGSAPFLPQLSNFRSLKDTLDAANFVFNGFSRFSMSGELFYFLSALGVKGIPNQEPLVPRSRNLIDSGLMHLRDQKNESAVFIKYPLYKFRPAQSDLLHVDIWLEGANIAKDLGTYSYNCPTDSDYCSTLSCISSHNTIQFASYDGMPKLSHFLYSNWAFLEFQHYSDDYWHGAYKTYFGSYHERKVSIYKGKVFIVDQTQSDCNTAVLRWYVHGNDWLVDGNNIKSKDFELRLKANIELTISLRPANESRFYMKLETLTCIEVLFEPKDATIQSTFQKNTITSEC